MEIKNNCEWCNGKGCDYGGKTCERCEGQGWRMVEFTPLPKTKVILIAYCSMCPYEHMEQKYCKYYVQGFDNIVSNVIKKPDWCKITKITIEEMT